MLCDLVVSFTGIGQAGSFWRSFCATGNTVYIYAVNIVKDQNMLLLVLDDICNLPSMGL